MIFLIPILIHILGFFSTSAFAGPPLSEGDIRILKNLARGGATAVTGWPTVSTIKEITWATSFANAIRFLDASNNGTAIYTNATLGPQIVCVIAGVENDCSYIRRLASGKYWEVQNSSSVSIARLTESTGAWTNMIIDATDASNVITLSDERHFPVATCQNATASVNFDTPTSNAAAAACDTGSNTQKAYLTFDATTDQSFQDHWILPTGFTSVSSVSFRWKAAATSGAVGWCVQLIRVADGSTSDPAFPSQASGNCVSDTAKGTTLQENTATITNPTCTSCTAGDHVYVRISRDADGGAVTDDMTGNALLLSFGRVFKVAQ